MFSSGLRKIHLCKFKYEPRHKITCLCHMRTTKAQISLRSLISAFVVRCLDSTIPLLAVAEISSLLQVSVAKRTGLSLTWSETLKTGFLVTWPKYEMQNEEAFNLLLPIECPAMALIRLCPSC